MSWKPSLSLASCLRQLCADGYVADRSNSCSPVLADRNALSRTLQEETPHYDLTNSTGKPDTGAGVGDIRNETGSPNCVYVVEPQPPLRSNSVPSESSEVLLSDGNARDGIVGRQATSEKPDLSHEDDWLASGHRILCASESDVCSSSAEVARYSSPVRRKSVRELKNRFESTADEGGAPVKTAAKKRPPVAKKPSIVRSAIMSKSLPKCDSSALAQDTGSDKGAVSGPESAPDCSSISWSQGCSGALQGALANHSVDSSSLMESYSSDTTEAAMRRSYEAGRPSSAASTASYESVSSESRAVSGHASTATDRKPRSRSLHATSVPDVLGLSLTTSNNSGAESSRAESFRESTSCMDTVSSFPDGSLEKSSCAPTVQQLTTKSGGERCFATVGYRDPKSLASVTDYPKEMDTGASVSGGEDKNFSASEPCGDVTISRRAPVPARRNPRRSEGRVGTECLASVLGGSDHSSGVDDRSLSSCDSLGTDPHSIAQGECAAPPRPAKPPRASPDPASRESSVGRVRGLSAMFEQQSFDRADGPPGRREQQTQRGHPQPSAAQDFSSQNSQGWRVRHTSNGDGEMAANLALRNLTIKL